MILDMGLFSFFARRYSYVEKSREINHDSEDDKFEKISL